MNVSIELAYYFPRLIRSKLTSITASTGYEKLIYILIALKLRTARLKNFKESQKKFQFNEKCLKQFFQYRTAFIFHFC